jgi:hypothetical protein
MAKNDKKRSASQSASFLVGGGEIISFLTSVRAVEVVVQQFLEMAKNLGSVRAKNKRANSFCPRKGLLSAPHLRSIRSQIAYVIISAGKNSSIRINLNLCFEKP